MLENGQNGYKRKKPQYLKKSRRFTFIGPAWGKILCMCIFYKANWKHDWQRGTKILYKILELKPTFGEPEGSLMFDRDGETFQEVNTLKLNNEAREL